MDKRLTVGKMKHFILRSNRDVIVYRYLPVIVFLILWVSPGDAQAGNEMPVSGLPNLGASSGSGVLDDASDSDSLKQVYEAALRSDHTLAAAQATYRAGLEEEVLGRAGLLPQIRVSGSYEDSFTEARGEFPIGSEALVPNLTDTDRETLTFAFTLNQPLFDLPAWFRFQRGRTLSKQAEATFAIAQQELIQRVAEAYFNILRARANLDAAKALEIALQSQLEQARQRFEVGMNTITDVKEAEAAYDTAVAERLATEGEIDIALEQLSVLTGRRHRAVWHLEEDFPVVDPEPADSDEWVAFARENNYEIQAASYRRGAAQQAARAAAAEHLPKVELSFGYTETDTDNVQENLVNDTVTPFPNNRDDRTVALNLDVPLFTGGATSANRRQASAQYHSERERYLATVRQVMQETRALFRRVTSDAARTRARRQTIVSSRSALEASQASYEAGTRDIVDVLNAQRALFAAKRDYANARIDYVVNRIRLKREAGILTPTDIHALNNWLQPPEVGEEEEETEGGSRSSRIRSPDEAQRDPG